MAEVFRKGAHIVRCADMVTIKTIKHAISAASCGEHAGARFAGERFMVKPRGSPCIWKVYEVLVWRDVRQIFKHTDLDVVRAWLALTQ